MRRIPLTILIMVLVLTGCASLPSAMPNEQSQAVGAIVTAITTSAEWKDVLARVDGQVIQPGMEGYYCIEHTAGVRLPGVSGQVKLEGEGTGTGAPKDAVIDAIIYRYTADPKLRDKIADKLMESLLLSPTSQPSQ